jgi:hypothetical protein
MLANLKNCEPGKAAQAAKGVTITPILTGVVGGTGKRSLPELFLAHANQLVGRLRFPRWRTSRRCDRVLLSALGTGSTILMCPARKSQTSLAIDPLVAQELTTMFYNHCAFAFSRSGGPRR